MDLLKELESYEAFDELEARDLDSTKQFLKAFGDFAYSRDCLVGHVTPSAWMVNPSRTKVVMAYHNIYKNFAWLGGHSDNEKNCLSVALKEVEEESGLRNVRVLNGGKVFDLNVMNVASHIKKGKKVSNHIHFTPVYLLEANEEDCLRIAEGENSAIKWVDNGDVINSTDEKFMHHIYGKLLKKVEKI